MSSTTNIINPLLLLCCTLFVCSVAQQHVPGIRIGPVRSTLTRASLATFATEPPLCSRTGFECLADCKTFMVCSEVDKPADRTDTCAADKPYCTNNACAERPDTNNDQCYGTADTTFVCTAVGLFPDPNSCTQYFSCAAISPAEAILYRCPAGSTYDSRLQTCVTTPLAAINPTCTTTMCRAGFVGHVAYPSNPAFYVLCVANTRMMFRCPDDLNQVYDAQLGECVFQCRGAGQFVDRQDCRRYYTCTRRGSRYTVVRQTCAPRFWYAGTRCEPDGATACVSQIV